jgi:sortase (surface protein transpeptidase)
MSDWRTKSYTLKLSPTRRLLITLRRYRTKKAKRAKTYRQVIVPIPGGLTHEVAVRYKTVKRRARRGSKSTPQRPPFRSSVVRPGAVITTVLIIIGLSGVGIFGFQIAQGHKLEPLKTFSSAPPVKEAAAVKPLPRSEPTHISVPSVGIDASVTSVGQDAEGSIEMPSLFDWTTGWYKYSPTPGQVGPAIIVGHVDTYKGISVFWKLRDIKQGDIIDIARADGKTVKFRVSGLKQFDQSNFPTKEVYGNLKYPGLRLITCGGAFNQQTESYTQNTVVYAFMIN